MAAQTESAAGSWLTERELSAWKNFTFMQLQLTARLARELADDGLSIQDYGVLVELTERPEGRVRISELGRLLGWEKSRVSHHLTRMVSRGLVTREKCPTDQRGAFAAVTVRGRQMIEAAAPAHVAAVRRHFIDLLTPEQIDAIATIASTVLGHLAGEPWECVETADASACEHRDDGEDG